MITYNEALADRVRELIAATGEERVEERRMFGGLCFMVDDKICVAVSKNRMLVRLDPAVYPSHARNGRLHTYAAARHRNDGLRLHKR